MKLFAFAILIIVIIGQSYLTGACLQPRAHALEVLRNCSRFKTFYGMRDQQFRVHFFVGLSKGFVNTNWSLQHKRLGANVRENCFSI
jgi:hypothetical protein